LHEPYTQPLSVQMSYEIIRFQSLRVNLLIVSLCLA
jgi:hypothetical protein